MIDPVSVGGGIVEEKAMLDRVGGDRPKGVMNVGEMSCNPPVLCTMP